jgi:hypothetical protein
VKRLESYSAIAAVLSASKLIGWVPRYEDIEWRGLDFLK